MILVYFEEDNSVSIVKETALVEELSTLSKGSKCSVKERSKVYSGLVVDIGKSYYIIFVIIVTEQNELVQVRLYLFLPNTSLTVSMEKN